MTHDSKDKFYKEIGINFPEEPEDTDGHINGYTIEGATVLLTPAGDKMYHSELPRLRKIRDALLYTINLAFELHEDEPVTMEELESGFGMHAEVTEYNRDTLHAFQDASDQLGHLAYVAANRAVILSKTTHPPQSSAE